MGIVNRTAGDKMIGRAGTRDMLSVSRVGTLSEARDEAADLRAHPIIVAHGHAFGGDGG